MTAKVERLCKPTKSHNMKRLALLFSFIFLCLVARAQQTYITATVTVTNCATNGDTFSLNGHLRTWTNNVTSANNQIQNTNGSPANAATNLFLAYITYPETSPYLMVTMTASNVLVFQTVPGSGPALTVATNGPAGATNWVTWTILTTPLTNAQVVRLPTNAIGLVEKTNDQVGFAQLFNDRTASNQFQPAAGMFSNFISGNSPFTYTNLTNGISITSNLIANLYYTNTYPRRSTIYIPMTNNSTASEANFYIFNSNGVPLMPGFPSKVSTLSTTLSTNVITFDLGPFDYFAYTNVLAGIQNGSTNRLVIQ